MLKLMVTFLIVLSTAMAQSSSDRSFSVHHSKHANFSLSRAQMREAESLYKSACVVVQQDFRLSTNVVRPHFTVVIGAETNEVHNMEEIRMRKWNPTIFAEGVVILAYQQELTADKVKQLGNRAVRYSNAIVDVAALK